MPILRSIRILTARSSTQYIPHSSTPLPGLGTSPAPARPHATFPILSPVLTAPVSAVPALFVTVRARPGLFRPVKPDSRGAPGGTRYESYYTLQTVAVIASYT